MDINSIVDRFNQTTVDFKKALESQNKDNQDQAIKKSQQLLGDLAKIIGQQPHSVAKQALDSINASAVAAGIFGIAPIIEASIESIRNNLKQGERVKNVGRIDQQN